MSLPRFDMTTTVGIRSKDGVVLAADKRASKGFFVGSKDVRKLFALDDTTAVAIAGQMSDAEYLVNLAKAERRLLALRRGYPLSVKESAKLISNIVYSGMKNYNPFFVELVVAGVDREGGHVYTSDMSGAVTSESFMSSGSGSPIAYGVLEQGYRQDLSLDDAERLAESAVRAAMERDPGSGNGVDVLVVPNGRWHAEAN
jgi:proteasome beta subunit